ncbi:hypothetical protein DLB55_22735 [Salmonella enterica subsp. enterica]|nr:hypothetical protein [Salmonella enterica subsp. enterica]
MTNNKLTDEKIKARINAIEDRRSASRDFWDGDWDYPEDIELLALRELQERRKADNQEPAGYHVIRECGKVGCSVATLEEAEKTRDFWNKKWTIRPYFYTAQPAPVVPDEWTIQDAVKFCRETGRQDAGSAMEAWNACRAAMLQGSQPVSDRDELPCAQVKAVADLYALCWQSGEVVTYTPDSEKAAIWLNNYSGTCVQEYVKLERFQGVVSGNSPVQSAGDLSSHARGRPE